MSKLHAHSQSRFVRRLRNIATLARLRATTSTDKEGKATTVTDDDLSLARLHREYAAESIRLLDYSSLVEAAAYFQQDDKISLDEKSLRRYLQNELRWLYKNDLARLAAFDGLLSNLESKELRARGWSARQDAVTVNRGQA